MFKYDVTNTNKELLLIIENFIEGDSQVHYTMSYLNKHESHDPFIKESIKDAIEIGINFLITSEGGFKYFKSFSEKLEIIRGYIREKRC